jgi:L-fuculose-phosphate aldolase
MEVGFDGKAVGEPESYAGLTVPQEIHIHTSIYKSRPDIHSVLHIHPATVVLFSICDQPLLPIYGGFEPFGLRFATKGVPVYDRTVLITTPELGRDLAAAMGDASVCIMRGHGITTAANSIEEATVYAIALNDLATMNYRAALLGGAKVVSAEDQKQMLQTLGRGVATPGQPPATVAAIWRYYLNLTGNALD